jgi:hypothetical protein
MTGKGLKRPITSFKEKQIVIMGKDAFVQQKQKAIKKS